MPTEQLSTPPKFGKPRSGPAPSSIGEWVQFFRWLTALFRVTQTTASVSQLSGFPAPPMKMPADFDRAAALAAQSFRTRQPRDPLNDGLMALLRQTGQARADEMNTAVLMAMNKVPFPQRANSTVIEDTHANRPSYSASAYPVGTLYFETDRTVFYQTDGTNWNYAAGIFFCTQATLPALGAHDANFLAGVTDFTHLLRWTGSAWLFAPGDPGSAFVQMMLVDPISYTTMWSPCFFGGPATGNVTFLQADGTTAVAVVPDLWSTGHYLKMGGAASGPNAAVAPGLTMNPYTPAGGITINPIAAHHHFAPVGTDVSHNIYALNVNGAAGSATATSVATGVANSTTQSPLLTSDDGGVTPTGSFGGTPATLTGSINTAGEPANYILKPWFRI